MKEPKKRRAKPFPANNESRKWLEDQGWEVCVVEQRLPHCFITKDAFGFGDILAMGPIPFKGIMMVQATAGASRGNVHARIDKIKEEPRHKMWLAAGGRIQVHNWHGSGRDRELEILEVTMETQ